MSAYYVGDRACLQLADDIRFLLDNGNDPLFISGLDVVENPFKDCTDKNGWHLEKMIAFKLRALNIQALKARYGEDAQEKFEIEDEPTWDDDIATRWDTEEGRYQLLKSLICFLYQCSEGDVSDTELFKAVDFIADRVKDVLIIENPLYQKAIWG